MKVRKILSAMGVVASLMFVMALSANNGFAQSTSETSSQSTKDDETNLDTRLFLIVGTNQDVAEPKLPALLDPVIKELRQTLPFKNYRLAATLMNRVKNEGKINLRWLGGPFAAAASSSVTPTFSEFNVRNVKLVSVGTQSVVQLNGFAFQARMPIQSGTAIAANGPAAPIISYETTGLNTDISMREGDPVVVGTLNIGPSGDAIILVVSAKRTNK